MDTEKNYITTLEGIIEIADSKGNFASDDSEVVLSVKCWNFLKNREEKVTIKLEEFEPKKFFYLLRKHGVLSTGDFKRIKAELKRQVSNKTLKVVQRNFYNVGFNSDCTEFVGARYISKSEIPGVYVGDLELKMKGSFENLVRMFDTEIAENYKIQAILCIGALATLLPFANKRWGIKSNTLVFHLTGESSSGKTTMGELIASFGGNPNPDVQNSLMMQFMDTKLAIIRKIGANQGVPMAIDEFSTAKNGDGWGKFIYTLCNGAEKDKLGAGGKKVNSGNRYHTVIVSTGERSIMHYAEKNTGIYVRLFEIFKEVYTSSKENSDNIKRTVENNYGILSPMIAEEIINRSEIHEQRYNTWNKEIHSMIESEECVNPVINRVTPYISLLMVAAELLGDVFDRKFDIKGIFDFFYKHIVRRLADYSDLTKIGMDLIEVYISNNSNFIFEAVWGFNHELFTPNEEAYCCGFKQYLKNTRVIDGVGYNVKYLLIKEELDIYLEKECYLNPRLTMCQLQDKGIVKGKTLGNEAMGERQKPYKTDCVINGVRRKIYEIYGVDFMGGFEVEDVQKSYGLYEYDPE